MKIGWAFLIVIMQGGTWISAYQLSQSQRTPVGEIHLKGQWLIQAGFAIDSPVTVSVSNGCLVVTTDH